MLITAILSDSPGLCFCIYEYVFSPSMFPPLYSVSAYMCSISVSAYILCISLFPPTCLCRRLYVAASVYNFFSSPICIRFAINAFPSTRLCLCINTALSKHRSLFAQVWLHSSLPPLYFYTYFHISSSAYLSLLCFSSLAPSTKCSSVCLALCIHILHIV